ncbi:DUF6537 domain-containing protein [Actinophytocola sp.]|uniref:DUF6537 domain-containing protein n=1 Tax=Actinophytocola sp. TaxID=1872138 RepID=UPI00389A1B24
MSNARPVADLAAILLHQGVSRVIITTEDRRRYRRVRLPAGVQVRRREDIVRAQEQLRATPGVTVLIHDQECAAERRRRRKAEGVAPTRRVVINERVCEGCGDCGVASNCLSVEPVDTEFGRKTRIDQTSCNVDYSCLAGDCPAFMSVRIRPDLSGAGTYPRLEPGDLVEPPGRTSADATTIRLSGIGGAGVVTANRILAQAAQLSGLHAEGLDQTGLSQKAGPVQSDLRLSRFPSDHDRRPGSAVDLHVVFDLRVGTSRRALTGLDRDHTAAVVSTSLAPTGPEVSDVRVTPPATEDLRTRLAGAIHPSRITTVEATHLAESLFATRVPATTILLGVAYQTGALPVPAAAIERAVERNGVATELNVLAFRWGRMWVQDRDRVLAVTGRRTERPGAEPAARVELPVEVSRGELGRVVGLRAADLVAYQDRRYASRYLATVVLAARAEYAVDAGSTRFTETVARYLYKLMAYKDEYEVARLLLRDTEAAVAEAVGPGHRVEWLLHPPLLRAAGLRRKISLGRWSTPLLVALHAARRLRGRALDPFGHTAVRRTERQLVTEYERLVEVVCRRLADIDLDQATRLAALPDVVRGYEDVKARNVEHYHRELTTLCRELGIPR